MTQAPVGAFCLAGPDPFLGQTRLISVAMQKGRPADRPFCIFAVWFQAAF